MGACKFIVTWSQSKGCICLPSMFNPHAPLLADLNKDRIITPVALDLVNEARRVYYCED